MSIDKVIFQCSTFRLWEPNKNTDIFWRRKRDWHSCSAN